MCNSEWALSLEVSDLVMTFYKLGRRMDHRCWRPRLLGSEGVWLVWKRAGCQHFGVWLNTLPNSDFWQAVRFQWKWTSSWWFIASAFKRACLLLDGVWVVVPPCFPTLLAVMCFRTSLCWCPLTLQFFSPSSLSHLLPPLLLCSFLIQLPSCRQCFLQRSCSWGPVALPEFRFWLFLTLFWRGTPQRDNTNLSFQLSWGETCFLVMDQKITKGCI